MCYLVPFLGDPVAIRLEIFVWFDIDGCSCRMVGSVDVVFFCSHIVIGNVSIHVFSGREEYVRPVKTRGVRVYKCVSI